MPTVSVLIPAYNEAKNIGALLRGVLEQEYQKMALREVIVYSDGSTDGTAGEARALADPRIQVIEGKERRGANAAENALLEAAQGDVVILLNADTRLGSKDVLERLGLAVSEHPGIGIAGARIISLPGRRFFEKAMATSHAFRTALYEALQPDGDTVYLCHGRARALSRELAAKLRFPDQCPEDAYSYFFAKKRGFGFRYAKDAGVRFRSPGTLSDHRRQSTRFASGREILRRYFPEAALDQAYRVPISVTLRTLAHFFLRHPLRMSSYLGILCWLRLTDQSEKEQSRWEISQTSKELIH